MKPALRSTPAIGQTYRHFKGNSYTIVRVVPDYSNSLKDGQELYWLDGDGEHVFTACNEINMHDTVVFYQGVDRKIWARSIDNFLEVLGDVEDPIGGTMYYRFELIGAVGGDRPNTSTPLR